MSLSRGIRTYQTDKIRKEEKKYIKMGKNESIIRTCFTAWQKRDWDTVESLLADGFTFTSPYDDHIDRREYKQKCWNSIKSIEEYQYVTIMEKGDEAFVRYKNRINGMLVQNTEHFLFQDGKIKAVDVFFGRPEDSTSPGRIRNGKI